MDTATFQAGAGNVSATLSASGADAGIVITPSGYFNGTIDNVSVRKVNDDGSLGPELVQNGKFNGITGWDFGKGVPPAGWVYRGGGEEGTLPTYQPSLLSAVARVEQGLSFPKFVVGGVGNDGETFKLFKKSTEYGFNMWQGPVFHVGFPFRVVEISLPLARPVGPDMSLTAVLRFDHEQTSSQIRNEINDTNYPNDEQFIVLQPDHFTNGVKGNFHFFLELQFGGPDVLPVSLPITVLVENERTGEQTPFTITSIFDGIMPSAIFGGAGQYKSGIGIDPDVPATDDPQDLKTGGIIRPVSYVSFSGEAVDSAPIAIITTPKNDLTYVVLSNGKLLSYDGSLDNETLIGRVQEGGMSPEDVPARGAWYYNNYIYITTPHDVSRYGPLDDSPTLTNEVWTGGTLGAQDVLTDSEYPVTLFDVGYLNHFGFVHVDGAAYFMDFADGIGLVHRIQTENGSNQGDSDSSVRPSAYGILDFPPDFIPITGCSYGNDIAVAGSFTTDSLTFQGAAAVFLFNPSDTEPSFYRIIYLPDAICTALQYDNGVLYGISGDLAGGYRVWRYVGGDSIETLKIVEDGYPPLQTAVTYAGNRIVWGANTQIPIVSAGLYGYGSKSDLFPRGLHHMAVLTDFQEQEG